MKVLLDSEADQIVGATVKIQVKFKNGTSQEMTFTVDEGSFLSVASDLIQATPEPVNVEIKGQMILQSSYLSLAPKYVGKMPIRTDLSIK